MHKTLDELLESEYFIDWIDSLESPLECYKDYNVLEDTGRYPQ